jgi:hypothetical protein
LDFYEQGIERVVSLIPEENKILVECKDMIKKPSSQTETMIISRKTLIVELVTLCNDFLKASQICCGNIIKHPWFVTWESNIQKNIKSILDMVP